MATVLEKLNPKDPQKILVLRAPASFAPELARQPVITLHRHIESLPRIGFALAFVASRDQIDIFAPQIAARAERTHRMVRLS